MNKIIFENQDVEINRKYVNKNIRVIFDTLPKFDCYKGDDKKAKVYYTKYLEKYPEDESAYNKLLEVSINENK